MYSFIHFHHTTSSPPQLDHFFKFYFQTRLSNEDGHDAAAEMRGYHAAANIFIVGPRVKHIAALVFPPSIFCPPLPRLFPFPPSLSIRISLLNVVTHINQVMERIQSKPVCDLKANKSLMCSSTPFLEGDGVLFRLATINTSMFYSSPLHLLLLFLDRGSLLPSLSLSLSPALLPFPC